MYSFLVFIYFSLLWKEDSTCEVVVLLTILRSEGNIVTTHDGIGTQATQICQIIDLGFICIFLIFIMSVCFLASFHTRHVIHQTGGYGSAYSTVDRQDVA